MTVISLDYLEDFSNAVVILGMKPIIHEENNLYHAFFAFDGDTMYYCQVSLDDNIDWKEILYGHAVINGTVETK